MDILEFDVTKPVHFNWTGKFIAPDENWIHMAKDLTDFELILMTEGELHIGEQDTESTVHANEYRIICPTPFQHGTKPSRCSFYWMHFSYNEYRNDPVRHKDSCNPQQNPAFQAASPAKTPQLPDGRDNSQHIFLPLQAKLPRPDRLVVLLKQLQDCNQKYGNRNLNNYYATTVLCELYSQLYLSEGRLSMKNGQIQLYSDILDYISWRLRENIRVSEIADYFGYNPKYITTFFKKASGTSLKQYILNRKIDLAKALLTDTNQPVAQIGYEVGFSDNHNFSNTFKRITGQTPSDYRNSYSQRMLFHQ